MFVPPFSEHLTCSFQPQPADGSFPHVSSNLGFFRSIQHQSTGKQDLETPTRRWRLQPGSSWWWFFSLFLFLEVNIPGGEISLAFDDFGCWFVFLRLGKLPKLESNSHQKPYKFPLPNFGRYKSLVGDLLSTPIFGFFQPHPPRWRQNRACLQWRLKFPPVWVPWRVRAWSCWWPPRCHRWEMMGDWALVVKERCLPPKKGDGQKFALGGMVDLWKFLGLQRRLEIRVWLNQIRFGNEGANWTKQKFPS